MLVYSAAKSPRLTYVLAFLGRECFEDEVLHTDNPEVFRSFPGVRLQYGGERLADAPFYLPSFSLLFESDIRRQEPDFSMNSGIPCLFSGHGNLSFDLFAGIFFLLSRYEEWLPFRADPLGRFPPEASIAFRRGFLDRPLIDEWLLLFQDKLKPVFPGIKFRSRSFSFLPTYDIDMAWSYSGKGLFRNAGGMIRDLLKGNLNLIRDRRLVLAGAKSDPFDCFSWLDRLHEKFRLQPYYFFLLAAKRGRFDKNISPSHPAMKALIRHHSERYRTGIHPSWQSGNTEQLRSDEITILRKTTKKSVVASRQHYLRLTMPGTYRGLLAAGIKNDFSMGYGTLNGFRASFSGDFFWYDVAKDLATDLLLTPFCFMDATAFYGEKLAPPAALEELRQLHKKIAGVHGRMVTLWHNHFLGTAPQFSGWREVYKEFVEEVCGVR